jgi:hypothetical protein
MLIVIYCFHLKCIYGTTGTGADSEREDKIKWRCHQQGEELILCTLVQEIA